jgi:hypothetical protein
LQIIPRLEIQASLCDDFYPFAQSGASDPGHSTASDLGIRLQADQMSKSVARSAEAIAIADRPSQVPVSTACSGLTSRTSA